MLEPLHTCDNDARNVQPFLSSYKKNSEGSFYGEGINWPIFDRQVTSPSVTRHEAFHLFRADVCASVCVFVCVSQGCMVSVGVS